MATREVSGSDESGSCAAKRVDQEGREEKEEGRPSSPPSPPAPRRRHRHRRAEEVEDDDDDSSSSTTSGPPPLPRYVNGKWRVKEKIGQGSYSVVHRGYDKETENQVAIKFEWVDAPKGRRQLNEARLIEKIGNTPNIPQLFWYGTQGAWNIMVMQLQGQSLNDLFTKCHRKFTLKTVLNLADQMLQRIEFVHSKGVVHRDIKPHNFLMGREELMGQVLIMDFGLAKKFKDKNGRHVPGAQNRGLTGTLRYVSLNVHAGLEPSRRDDLEAIGYVLLHFLRGTLPWQGLKGSSRKSKHEKIRKSKQNTTPEELCEGFPNEFVAFFKHIRALQFHEKPNYGYLRGLIHTMQKREGCSFGGFFDWEKDASSQSSSSSETHYDPAMNSCSPRRDDVDNEEVADGETFRRNNDIGGNDVDCNPHNEFCNDNDSFDHGNYGHKLQPGEDSRRNSTCSLPENDRSKHEQNDRDDDGDVDREHKRSRSRKHRRGRKSEKSGEGQRHQSPSQLQGREQSEGGAIVVKQQRERCHSRQADDAHDDPRHSKSDEKPAKKSKVGHEKDRSKDKEKSKDKSKDKEKDKKKDKERSKDKDKSKERSKKP